MQSKNTLFIILVSSLLLQLSIGSPIIGILSQETSKHASYIAASYVKYIESTGARAVPIWIGQDRSYYERAVNYTNGMLFPGGAAYFNETGKYGEAANIIYSIAVKLNQEGTYYPIWGTCLGFEALLFGAMNGHDIRIPCNHSHVAATLTFTKGYEASKMFKSASTKIIEILSEQNSTYNNHRYCITEAVLKENGLQDDWKILSTTKDSNGMEFISTLESNKYPFYGVQFHPEKNIFEFKKGSGIPHTRDAVKIGQYFANFFMDECRKNKNSFPTDELVRDSVIYNFLPEYTGKNGSSFVQSYYFEKSDFKNHQLL